jgi:heat shock protein HslJ
MRRWLAFAISLVAWIATSAAASATDTEPTLVGRAFHSVEITEAGFPASLVAGTSLTLVFMDSDHLGASAGCNSYGATYQLIGSQLVIKDDVQTLIACRHDLESQDQWLFDLLRRRPTIAISGSSLALGKGDLLVQFLEVVRPTPAFDPLST